MTSMTRQRITAESVEVGDRVLRYGMWFTVEHIYTLPAEGGGDLVELHLHPAPDRIPRGAPCTLALFPDEGVTAERKPG